VLKNPGIKDFRDPKVFWHEASKKWVMILAAQDHVEFYGSSDLKSWTKAGEFVKEYGAHGGVWECPDLFELKAEGDTTSRWVMLLSINPGGPNGGSATQYFVGDFDGKAFTTTDDPKKERWIDYGPDNYAGVTWSNAPDNRKIFLGWMNNWAYGQVVPTERWRGAMTTPRDLSLVKINEEYFLRSKLSDEFRNYSRESKSRNFKLPCIVEGVADAKRWNMKFTSSKAETIEVKFTGNSFTIERDQGGMVSISKDFPNTASAPRISSNPEIPFTMVVDVSSIEVFFDDGFTVMTCTFFFTEPLDDFEFETDEEANLKSIQFRDMESIWNSPAK
jgi:fructan beta-fructosidase